MNIFVLGASGRTGGRVIADALHRGHAVTALVRSHSRLSPRSRLRVIVGDPRDREKLSASIENQDAVISCLGQKTAADATLLRESARALIAAMTARHVQRLVVISQGLLFPTSSVVVPILRFLLARHVEDSRAMEDLVSHSQLDWTIVRPPLLLERNVPHGYRIALETMPKRSIALPRIDLAGALLDEVDTLPHVRTVIGVASK